MNWSPTKADSAKPPTGIPGNLIRAALLFGGIALTDASIAQQFQFQGLPPETSGGAPPVAATQEFQAVRGGLPAAVQQTAFLEPAGSPLVYRLRNCDWQNMESRLLSSGLVTAHAAVSANGRIATWFVALPGEEAEVSLDRQNGALSVRCRPELAPLWQQCLGLIDCNSTESGAGALQFVPLRRLKPELARATVHLMSGNAVSAPAPLVIRQDPPVTQPSVQDPQPPRTQEPGQQAEAVVPMGALAPRNVGQDDVIAQLSNLQDVASIGNVTIQVLPELGMVIIKGENQADVDRVKAILNEIVSVAGQNQPQLKRIPLLNSEPAATATQVKQVYDEVYAANQGTVSVSPIADPRALLLAGSKESIATLEKIVAEYDVAAQVLPLTANFKTYSLRFITASDAKQRIDEYFGQAAQQALATPPDAAPVVTVADYRSNTLIVKASPSYLQQVDQLLEAVDVVDTMAKKAIRVYRLKNTLASTVASVLQGSINGGMPGAPQGFNPNPQAQQLGNQGFGGVNQGGASSPGLSSYGSASLSLVTIGDNGEPIDSGILFDVRVSADATSNSLLVTAPEKSIPLIEALITQLDRIPDAETQIKVFQVINGDAQTLYTMLQSLFPSQANQGAGGFGGFGGAGGQQGQLGSLPLQTSSAGPGTTLANLRFSVDGRTNTIIASGPVGDLEVIESLLIRLDTEESLGRRTYVYRVANLSALDLSDAVNAMLDSRRQLITSVDPTSVNDYTSSRREVIVQAEAVGNSLIVNARPEYIDEVMEIIQALDRRPPMVKIKVLMAEVNLSMLEEMGIDIGLQDSLLFDRGLSNIRYPFNGALIGNDNSAASLATRENIAGQALSNLGTGRLNTDLGYGGLVLSAGSESVNVLLRALKDKQCSRVLTAPQVMGIEGQAAYVQVGADVRMISNTTITNGIAQNSVEVVPVGVILEITPRVSPDGMIVMRVNVTNSSLGPLVDGTVVGSTADGSPIVVPPVNKTTAQTTIMSRHGQTVVFSGLITEDKSRTERGVPILSDLPLLGNLFKFQSENATRSELLIILTPYLVDGDEDIETLNTEDMDRMHWCINDVAEIYGSVNYDQNRETYAAPLVYHPDADPAGHSPVQSRNPDGSGGSAEASQPLVPQASQRRDATVQPAGLTAPLPEYESAGQSQPAAAGGGNAGAANDAAGLPGDSANRKKGFLLPRRQP